MRSSHAPAWRSRWRSNASASRSRTWNSPVSGLPMRRGVMLVLSSPSGAGKTSIANRLLAEEGPGLALSVSVTTRARRANEVHGRDYTFIAKPEFDRLVAAGALLEHAQVFGNFYGTPAAGVEATLA